MYFLLQESVSVLQVTQESVSGTTSHVHASERATKLKVHVIKSLSPFSTKLYQKKSFVAVGIVIHAARNSLVNRSLGSYAHNQAT